MQTLLALEPGCLLNYRSVVLWPKGVAVLTTSGTEDFCCGGDLAAVIPLWTGQRQPESDLERQLVEDYGIVDRVLLKDKIMEKPIVATVNGEPEVILAPFFIALWFRRLINILLGGQTMLAL